MQKLINITLKAAAAILAVILAASCVFEKENPVSKQQKQNVLVQIGVSTDGMAQTKADVITGDDQDGEGVEKTISTLRVYAYIGGDLSGYAYVPEYSSTSKIYMDLKNLPASGNVDVRFMAVANEGSMKASTTSHLNIEVGTNQDGSISLPSSFGLDSFNGIIYEIANQQFTTGDGEQKKTVGMPMYADATVKINVDNVGNPNTGDHEGHFILQQAVNLTLTRSLAKIEVYAAESASATTAGGKTDDTSVTITGVSLANVPQSGNLFTAPAAKATLTYTDFNGDNTDGTGYSATFLKAGTVTKKVNQDASDDIKNPDNYTLVSNAYYLAENNQGDEAKYDYGATDYTTKATVLKIDYTVGGTPKTGYVKMPQIKRNTWYKVLARIKANGKAEIKVVAVAWNYNSEVISFEEIVSMTGSPVWKDNNGVVVSGSTTSYTFGANRNQTATCEFTLQTPKGGTWYATIEGNDIQDFTFVDKNDQDEEEVVLGKTVSGAIGVEDDMTFTIKTLTDIGFGQSKTVKVRLIAVSKDGISQNVQISGEDYFTITQQN